jgi:hypothetical protein
MKTGKMETHVVAFSLKPVERCLGAIGTVSKRRSRAFFNLGVVSTTTPRGLAFSNFDCRVCLATSDFAPEAIHVVLQSSSVSTGHPEESTDAALRRTGWHPAGNVEVGETGPYAGLVDAEDGEVFGLNIVNITLVRDSQTTACCVFLVFRMELDGRRARAGVVSVAYITTIRALEERSCTPRAAKLCGSWLPGRQIKEDALLWREAEVIVEPPLLKGEVTERRNGAIVVRKVSSLHIKTPHAGMEEG